MMKLYTNKEGIELLTKFNASAFAIDKPADDMTIPIQVNAMMTHFKNVIIHKDEFIQVYEVDGHIMELE